MYSLSQSGLLKVKTDGRIDWKFRNDERVQSLTSSSSLAAALTKLLSPNPKLVTEIGNDFVKLYGKAAREACTDAGYSSLGKALVQLVGAEEIPKHSGTVSANRLRGGDGSGGGVAKWREPGQTAHARSFTEIALTLSRGGVTSWNGIVVRVTSNLLHRPTVLVRSLRR